jgi:hypothetical protein
MRTAMLDASSYPLPAAARPLGRMGEIGHGILSRERACFLSSEIPHLEGGPSARH